MRALVAPGKNYVGCNEVLALLADVPGARLAELASLPLGAFGQRLLALRYFLLNGPTWLSYFACESALERSLAGAPRRIHALRDKLKANNGELPSEADLTR